MRFFRNTNYLGCSIILFGLIILIFSLTIDIFRSGKQPANFGLSQSIGVVLGSLLLLSGVTVLWRKSVSGIGEFIQTHTTLLSVCLAIALGLAWLLYIYNAGIRFSPDSVSYMSFALKMHYAGDYQIGAVWPPLYPIFLHLAMYSQKFPAEAAALVSGLSMMGVLVVTALILRKYSGHIGIVVLFLTSLFIWDKYISIYSVALSEAPFSFILVLALYFIITHQERHRILDYILAAIVVSLSPFVRYAGLVLVISFMGYTIYYLYITRSKNASIAKYLLLYTISYLPIALYLYKNERVTGTLFGERIPLGLTVFQNINRAFDVFLTDVNLYLRILILLSVALFIVIITSRSRAMKGQHIFPVTFIFLFGLLYTGFIIYISTRTQVDPINSRYFAPLYPYLLIFIFICVTTISEPEVLEKTRIRNVRLYQIGVFSLVFLSLLANLKGFNEGVDAISKKQFAASSHTDAGFNLSTTSEGINAYLQKTLAEQDHINLSVIMDPQPAYRRFFGPDLLFRKSSIQTQKTTHFSFGNFFSFTKDHFIRNYTLSFQEGDKNKAINYLVAPRISDDQQLANFLIRFCEEYDTDKVILIVYRENLHLIGEDYLLPPIEEQFNLVSLEDIDPYQVYELSRKQ